jgi:predicted transposase YbfD/YdcC
LPQVSSIALIQHERDTYEEKSIERRFYISSLSCEAEELMRVIRSHWDIENSVHWVLDVVFREDESRIRRDHGGENMKVLRHAALNLLRQAGGEEDMSLRMKRKRAGWDDSFVDDLVDF